MQFLREEVQALKLIKHNNVPLFIECYESVLYVKKNGQKYEIAAIVMEHIQNGDLFDYLLASEDGFSEEVTRTLFKSLIESKLFFLRTLSKTLFLALGDIHSQGIAHRDLKIENLLLDKDFNLKVGDFGLASKIRDERGEILLQGKRGTQEYMAPETWSQDLYHGTAVDIFACGVILFKLLTAFSPFYYANIDKDPLYHRIAKKDYEAFWDTIEESVGQDFNDGFKDLVNSMLAFEPKERPTIQQIKEHPWFKGSVIKSEDMKEALGGLKEKVHKIRVENRQSEKEEAAEAKALANKMKKVGAPYAFNGIHVKK